MSTGTLRVRFAPSPTGHLHIGGLRSAIFNWLYARHHGGTFLIRVEDTDVARSSEAYVQSQLASLAWLGLSPDEPIVYQLSRIEKHKEAARHLLLNSRAYPCFCDPRDADQLVSDLEMGLGSKYAGVCRNKTFTEQDLQKPHAIRFKLPDGMQDVVFNDLVLGEIRVNIDQLDDFVIVRRDGTPVYNFCVVVDDIDMKISHIIRGQDHVSNTPKQILLYDALGAQPPYFAHIPLILGPNGGKLSKRDAAVSVGEYHVQGYLPEALMNYLVRLGWSHGDQEVFTADELIRLFTLDSIGKKGSIFDVKKLQWLNAHYMKQKDAHTLLDAIKSVNQEFYDELVSLWPDAMLTRLIDEYKQRASTLVDLYEAVRNLAKEPGIYNTALIAQWVTPQTADVLEQLCAQLESQQAFADHAVLSASGQELCKHYGLKTVQLAQPIRLALTGGIASPGVFELMSLLGKECSLRRIRALVAQLRT